MRNLKKILAVITVIAMLASMMVVPALAEGFKYENEAKVLNDLGLMAGYGLGDEVNRAQGIVFALKAAGKAAEVEAMTDEEAAQILDELVVDKDQVPAWAVKWVAYAVKNGFTSGVDASVAPKVKFAPLQSMTAAELLVWLMNIGMGYKVGTDVSVSEAVNAGIITLSQAMELGPKTALIRDDVAGILFGAAKNGVNADGKKFIVSLIEAGFVSEEAAIAAGLIEAKPAVLEVVSVSADNLKQLVVVFNAPIKEAGNQDNYSIETDDAQATIDKDSKFNLQDDKKTVVITLTKAAAQNEVIDLKIKGIESEDGLKLDETIIEDVKFEDTTLPKAVSAEVVGKYTIKVKFSEPIAVPDVEKDYDPDDYFVVDDGDYLIEKIEKVNSDTELNIVLYSALEEGTVTVEAKPAIKDYAGYGITKKVFTVDVVEDETAPVIVGYKNAKPSEVTLIFDEDIKLLEEPDKEDGKDTYKSKTDFLAKFYHTNSKNPASDLTVDGKELTIKFGVEKKMTEGNTFIYIDKEVLQDLWENKNAKYSYVVSVTDDNEPPVVDKIEQESEEAIKVVFNEDVNDTALDLTNYKVLDSKGEEKKDIIDIIKRDDDKTVIITFSEKLSGEYKLVVEKVEDVLENAMSKTTVAFTMKDKTAPNSTADNAFRAKVYNAGKKGQLVKVFFKDTMATEGKYSVLDLDKYEINIYSLADIKGVKIKIVDNGRAAEITIPSIADIDKDDPKPGKDYLNVAAGYDLWISKVADAAGNTTPTILNWAEIEGSDVVEVDKVEQTAKDTIVITLKDKLSKFDSGDFKEAVKKDGVVTTDDTVAVKSIRHTVNDDGVSVVTLTLKDWNSTDASELELVLADTNSANKYGEELEEDTFNVVDKAAPVVDKIFYVEDADDIGTVITGFDTSVLENDEEDNVSYIVIRFSEDIDEGTYAEKSKNGFSVSGGKAKLLKVYLEGNFVILEGEHFSKTTDVYYKEAGGLADADGNTIKDFSKTDNLETDLSK